MVTEGVAKAALPAELVHSTIQAAALVAAGNRTAEGVLSAGGTGAGQGSDQTMFWNKFRIAVVLLVAASSLPASAGGQCAYAGGPGQANATRRGAKPGRRRPNKTRIRRRWMRNCLRR